MTSTFQHVKLVSIYLAGCRHTAVRGQQDLVDGQQSCVERLYQFSIQAKFLTSVLLTVNRILLTVKRAVFSGNNTKFSTLNFSMNSGACSVVKHTYCGVSW